jgi:hypothetical protein
MPFSERDEQRIAQATHRVERYYRDYPEPQLFPTGYDSLELWFELTENPDANTFSANASPVVWSMAANSNAGGYTTDTNTTVKVRDTIKCFGPIQTDRVKCRPIGSANGAVWEITWAPGHHYAKVTAELTANNSANAVLVYRNEADTGWEDTNIAIPGGVFASPLFDSNTSASANTYVDIRYAADTRHPHHVLVEFACSNNS